MYFSRKGSYNTKERQRLWMSLLRAASQSSHRRIPRTFATNSKVTAAQVRSLASASSGQEPRGALFRLASGRLVLCARRVDSSGDRALNSRYIDYRCFSTSTARSLTAASRKTNAGTPQSQVEAASKAMQVDSSNGAAKLIDGNAIAK